MTWGSFDSFGGLGGYQPGGILGGSGQGSSWNLPSWGGSSSSGGSSSFPSLDDWGKQLGSLGSGWGSSQAMGGNDSPSKGSGSSSSSFPSWGSALGGGSSGSFPSLANWGSSWQPGGILGGAGQGSSSGQSGSGQGGYQAGLNQVWSGLGGSAAGGGGSSNVQMPSGFASQLPWGNSSMTSGFAPPGSSGAPNPSAGGSQSGGSYTSPAALTGANSKAINNATVTQGSLTYTPLANSNTNPSQGAPELKPLGSSADPNLVSTATDQYGRQFNYAKSVDSSGGGKVVGVSANGTVLKQVDNGQGRTVIYDTGASANSAPRQQQPSVAVGRPTQTSQPRTTPVVQTSAPVPTQKQKDDETSRNQGNWLQ